MRSLYIISTAASFDFEGKKIKIGGVETYIRDLAALCSNNGYDVVIYAIDSQNSNCDSFDIGSIVVKRIFAQNTLFKTANQVAFENVYSNYNNSNSVFVIATDQMDIKSKSLNIINIQHGIPFDIPGYLIKGLWGRNKYFQFINKLLRCIRNIKRFENIKNTVCVDYNYFNWFRTLGTIYPNNKFSVIPNYSSSCISERELREKINDERKSFKIVFARRFVDYRGVLIFANVIKKIFQENANILVTFAGEGPLSNQVKNMFQNDKRVTFTSFSSSESIDFHKQFDIAVVPTIYSEGTSLSLNEAMSSGCLPICTYVGGMSNMIINGYNGIMTYPDEDSLYKALKLVLSMPKDDFDFLVKNAYYSSTVGFCKERWNMAWLDFLNVFFTEEK